MLSLTKCQSNALASIAGFLGSPDEQFMVIEGYSGTGKSTLVVELINRLEELQKTLALINPQYTPKYLELTATTHKACDALRSMTGIKVRTIFSLLGIQVEEDWDTGEPIYKEAKAMPIYGSIIIVDEFSYVTKKLLELIKKYIRDCKVIFLGDPDQLIQDDPACIESLRYRKATLTTIVRQSSENNELHPISAMGQALRLAVHSGELPECNIDDKHLIWLPDNEFEKAIQEEFVQKKWYHTNSRILCRSNAMVTEYNNYIFPLIHNRNHFEVGDYVVNNKFFMNAQWESIATDQIVRISGLHQSESFGVSGMVYMVQIRNKVIPIFVPDSPYVRRELVSNFRKRGFTSNVKEITQTWGDLRPLYASTVHKSQGSTFDKVFIDLNDIGGEKDKTMLARLLYVAVTRARHQVIFRGNVP